MREILGTNQSPERAQRTSSDISRIEHIAFESALATGRALSSPINTKWHRSMFHVGDYLHDFECIRKGSTDENEKLHRHTKRVYKSSNHHLTQIAPQILSARTTVVADAEKDFSSQFHTQLLLTRTEGSDFQEHRRNACEGQPCSPTVRYGGAGMQAVDSLGNCGEHNSDESDADTETNSGSDAEKNRREGNFQPSCTKDGRADLRPAVSQAREIVSGANSYEAAENQMRKLSDEFNQQIRIQRKSITFKTQFE